MKLSFTLIVASILSLTVLNSCNEKIQLVGDFTETAVVYGLLDKSDSIHVVKINRAFIGPGNSLEIAQIPDSTYFDQVDATVTEVINGVVARTWTLEDTLIENKDTNGIFYAPEQKVYYFKTTSNAPLNDNGTYKLAISLNGGEFEVTGETALVKGISTSADAANFRFDFAKNPGEYLNNGLAVSTGNSYVINSKLQVNMEEFIGNTVTQKSFEWTLGEAETNPASSRSFTMNGKTFYDLVKANVTANSSITKRRLKSIKVITTGGSDDLNNYILVNKPGSSLAQNKPTYTNLKTTSNNRVVGIFSSRFTHTVEKLYINPFNTQLRMITTKSVIELCKGNITGTLLFCSQHPIDMGTEYYCQ
jgi:hypothetical protein